MRCARCLSTVTDGFYRRTDLTAAFKLAVQSDAMSAFGGIVAFNREVDAVLAECIRDFRSPTDGETKMFFEIVIAPSYTPQAIHAKSILRLRVCTCRDWQC